MQDMEKELIGELNEIIMESRTISDDVMESSKRVEEYLMS